MNSVKPHVPRMIVEVSDEELGLLGYLVIDRVLSGPSIGGVRLRDGLTLNEVADLAREMTLKYAFLNIPCGGAKAGVLWRPFSNSEERQKIFTFFGKNLGPVLTKRIYIPGEDMGTSLTDIYHMKKGAGLDIPKPASNNSVSGYYTALTVLICAERLAQNIGVKISGARVTIDGFGKVGTFVAQLFANAGAKITAISTLKGALYNRGGIDIGRFLELKRTAGDDAVNMYSDADAVRKEGLLALDADIFVPCAGPYTITRENVAELKATMVVPGANLAATAEAESIMYARGIHFMPSFVSSCGGVLCYAVHEQGFGEADTEWIIRGGFGENISHLISGAQKNNISISQRARKIAEDNLRDAERLTEGNGKEIISASMRRRQNHNLREILAAALWKSYKLSFKVRASRLLRPFVRSYMQGKLSQEAPPWTKL